MGDRSLRKRMIAALLTACMVLGTWHVMPAFAAETDDAAFAETVQVQEPETEDMQPVLETDGLPETAAAAETAAEETDVLPEMPEVQAESETVQVQETEMETETEPETETETVIETETETTDEEDPGALYDLLRAAARDGEEAVLLEAGTTARKVKAVGVDVWNGNGKIDWAKAKAAGVQFAIIRVGFRYLGSASYEVDARAKENMDGATKAGVPFGVYFFSTAVNVNEGLEEAALVIKTIRNYKLDYPVFFDPEGYDLKGMRNYGVSKSVRTNIALKFMSYIENNGYQAAMYSSKSHLTASAYWETPKLDSAYDIWVAQYPGGLNTLASGKTAQTTYTGEYRIWQFSSTGKVDGISGNVDLNVEYYKSAQISGIKQPASLKAGENFSIGGKITSETKITNVSAAVYNAQGKAVLQTSAAPGTTSYDLASLAGKLNFAGLSGGIYRYQASATNSAGSRTLVNRVFVVLSGQKTAADGVYHITPRGASGFTLAVQGQTSAVPADLMLVTQDNENNHARFSVKYDKDGWYKITVLGSGKLLGTDGSAAAQTTAGTRWQILPYGDGSYAFVSEAAADKVLSVDGVTAAAGNAVILASPSLDDMESFTLTRTAWVNRLGLKDNKVPTTLVQGQGFSPSGTVTCDGPLEKVHAQVVTLEGTVKLDAVVQPAAKTYALSGLDSMMLFSQLPAGVYTYKIYASDNSHYKLLSNTMFVVLAKGRTISDGTYNIASAINTGYVLSVKGDSKAAGGNIHLWTLNKTNKFEQYKVIYQSDGYYRIQVAGSSKYLGVANQSAKSGTNVEQQNTGTLWQIVPNGKGYVLIPRCASACMLNLTDANVAKGTNIRIFTYSASPASRWNFTPVQTTTTQPAVNKNPATIKNQTQPGTLTAGSSFSIRGEISSPTKLTSVTVGVYDLSGKMKIGKTVNPGKTSYDLKNLDTSVKFGTLSAGVYAYKVLAANSGGQSTLVNKAFIVLAKGSTVANGTYNLAYAGNAGYAASVKSNSKAANANIHLWTLSSSNKFAKFTITYQSNGYYRIVNVGSGRPLTVEGLSSKSGSNVKMGTKGTLWQILPYGNGSYALVPQCAKTCVFSLASSKAAKGLNILISTVNNGAAQRIKLIKR